LCERWILAIVSYMEESGKPPHLSRPSFRRRASEPSPSISGGTYPVGETVSAKHLGYLYAHCRLTIPEIIARYPNRLNLSLVFYGLHLYAENKAAFDAELNQEAKFNLGDSLKDASLSLPRLGLSALVDVEEMFQAKCKADRARAMKEAELKRLQCSPPQPKTKPLD
jgi:hypothetical protein